MHKRAKQPLPDAQEWKRPRSRTLGDLLDEIAELQPQARVAHGRGRDFSYEQLAGESAALAAALAGKFNVRRGERIALLCTNRLEWLIAAFAAARLGAPIVAISSWSKGPEIEYLLKHERPEILVTLDSFRGNDYLATWKELIPELWTGDPASFRSARFPSLRHVFVIDAQEGARPSDRKNPQPSAALNFNSVLEQGRSMPRLEENLASAADIALVLYTSGSSARPKAVPLQHFGCVENGFQIGERQRLSPADRGWLTLPLCWSYGSVITFMSLMTHGACAILQEGFEPGEALDLIEAHRCTGYYGQANMLHALVEHPNFDSRRTASLRTGLTTGTPDDIRLTAEVLGAREVCTIYGLTEVYGNCVVSHCSDPLEWRMHGQGLPLPGVTMRVVDSKTGADVAPGEVGEFWVKGYVMPGYLDEPEQNRLAFSDDGFFKTGDLGTIDANGHVHFQGRLKEVIKTGGINVSPLEVEELLQGCEGVVHACVVGVPHPIKGEVVAALVRAVPGSGVSVDALRAECRARMASYKVPEIFLLVDELPTTDTGKLSRKRSLALLQKELGLGA